MPRHMRRQGHRPPPSPVSLTKVARLGVHVLYDWGQSRVGGALQDGQHTDSEVKLSTLMR